MPSAVLFCLLHLTVGQKIVEKNPRKKRKCWSLLCLNTTFFFKIFPYLMSRTILLLLSWSTLPSVFRVNRPGIRNCCVLLYNNERKSLRPQRPQFSAQRLALCESILKYRYFWYQTCLFWNQFSHQNIPVYTYLKWFGVNKFFFAELLLLPVIYDCSVSMGCNAPLPHSHAHISSEMHSDNDCM